MNYQEINGNLIELSKKGAFDVIAHGANCKKIMGAGLALQIKKHYPIAWQIDQDDTRGPLQRLGDMTVLNLTQFVVVNLYTQYNPGAELNYTALRLGLFKMNQKYKGKRIGLPMIGCGIGGGHWDSVKMIIKEELCDCNVTIVMFKQETNNLSFFQNFLKKIGWS